MEMNKEKEAKISGLVIYSEKNTFILSQKYKDVFVETDEGVDAPVAGTRVIVAGEREDNKVMEPLFFGNAVEILRKNVNICEHKIRRSNERLPKLCKSFKLGKNCTDRYCPLRHYFVSLKEERKTQSHRGHLRAMEEMETDPNDHHDPKKKKDLQHRHWLFASFLVRTFSKEFLLTGPVLDVAGGYGYVAYYLFKNYDIKGVVVDPIELEEISDDVEKTFDRIPEEFNWKFAEKHEKVLRSCSLIVGLHPDEATENIAEIGRKYRKPVCIVPCCLHTSKKWIISYEQYFDDLNEILEKKGKVDFLNMKGRNKVLFTDSM